MTPPRAEQAARVLDVVELIKSLQVGGAEMLLVQRLERRSDPGVRRTVWYLTEADRALVGRLAAVGVGVVDLSSRVPGLAYARLATRVLGTQAGVVSTHSPLPAVVARLASRLRRGRPALVHTVHSERYRRATALADRLTRRLDDHTVAVSLRAARSPLTLGARCVDVRVHGVDVERQRLRRADRSLLRQAYGVEPGEVLLAHVANLRPEKNHALLLAAVEAVAADRPEVKVLLAGEGPTRLLIEAEILRRGLQHRVRLLGHVPDGAGLVAAADLLVLSSDHEGLPVVVFEALAAGVPVVATDVGGVAELVRSGVNGLLVPPGSVSALAEALRAATEPERLGALSAGAATTVVPDIAATAEWTDALVRRVSDEARGA